MSRRCHILITILTVFTCFDVVALQAAVWPSGREAIQFQAQPFDLRDVKLLDGPFRNAMQRDRKYLHALESEIGRAHV